MIVRHETTALTTTTTAGYNTIRAWRGLWRRGVDIREFGPTVSLQGVMFEQLFIHYLMTFHITACTVNTNLLLLTLKFKNRASLVGFNTIYWQFWGLTFDHL